MKLEMEAELAADDVTYGGIGGSHQVSHENDLTARRFASRTLSPCKNTSSLTFFQIDHPRNSLSLKPYPMVNRTYSSLLCLFGSIIVSCSLKSCILRYNLESTPQMKAITSS